MADNLEITPGTGSTVATDDVAGAHFQRVKLDGGGDGASLPLVGKTTPPLATTPALPTREVGQDTWSVGFSATQTALDSNFSELKLGSGLTRAQANSNLTINSGIVPNAEFLARSTAQFHGAMLLRLRLTASQRLTTNNFVVMLADTVGDNLAYVNTTTALTVTFPGHGFTATAVGQSIFVGGITTSSGTALPGRYAIASVPDANTIVFTVASWVAGAGTLYLFGRSYVRLYYTAANTTTMQFDVGNNGWSDAIQTPTINSTNTPGHQVQVHLDGRNAYLADALVASSATANMTTRASRSEYLPADAQPLSVYIWSYNGPSAPASGTIWTLGAVSVEDYANIPVYVAGQRMQGTAAAAPVAITNNPFVSILAGVNLLGDVALQYRASATGAASIKNIVSLATTNATSVKNTGGRLLGWQLSNTTAAWKYVKLHNTVGVPTAGASVGLTIGLPPNTNTDFKCEAGAGFSIGIGYTIVGGSADADVTAIAAGDVVGSLFYA